MARYRIETLGCKVNHYESQALGQVFEARGYLPAGEDPADVTVINTCTVTNLSDKKSRQAIRQAKRKNPDSLIVVMGCYSQVKPEEVAGLEEVDLVFGSSNKGEIVDRIQEAREDRVPGQALIGDLAQEEAYEKLSLRDQGHMTRAYMKVQDGCNQFCSYCIIPHARGRIRSRSLEDSVKEAQDLVSSGYQELVLTGIHIGSYGLDLEGDLGLIDLIEALAQVEGLKRIRLSSIEPMTITEDFLQRGLATGLLCDHFHLSLQSGSDEVLRAMNRHYTTSDYKKTVDLIRSYMPHAGITTDIIVGFPGETDKNFQETLDFVREVGFSRLHVFPYSPREGTPAAGRKDQVHGTIKKERARTLTLLGEETQAAFIKSQAPHPQSILFEEDQDGVNYGYTSNYIRVYAQAGRDLNNLLACGKIVGQGTEPVQVIPWEG